MKTFTYERVTTPAEAGGSAQRTEGAKFIAGGTNLLDLMKLEIETPTHLIDVNGLALDSIEATAEGGLRIGADLKTISMWNIKQEGLRAKLHREIIERDYHLSAAMYCETAALDQFFWIFVNKDENYHWIAIIEASEELLELGMLEYRKAMRAIANGFDTGEWPAPITEDYTEELNDFDMRRLEALRVQA